MEQDNKSQCDDSFNSQRSRDILYTAEREERTGTRPLWVAEIRTLWWIKAGFLLTTDESYVILEPRDMDQSVKWGASPLLNSLNPLQLNTKLSLWTTYIQKCWCKNWTSLCLVYKIHHSLFFLISFSRNIHRLWAGVCLHENPLIKARL